VDTAYISVNKVKAILFTVVMAAIAFTIYIVLHSMSLALLLFLGFVLAVLDTALGMGYGTVGTPILLIVGMPSKIAVPAILLSQFAAATLGSFRHYKLKNADILHWNKDGKIAAIMVGTGLLGAIVGAMLGISLPKIYVSSYIGLLVIAMGIILVAKPKATFSWFKLFSIAALSGFNKAISGGGYGPVSTSGLLISGNPAKNSVGITVFSVALINIFAFVIYMLASSITSFTIFIAITLGAMAGSQVGPMITHKLKNRDISFLGIVVLVLGILTIITTFIRI